MDALTKLQELYEFRDNANAQIEKIERLLEAEPKQRKKRGPNKPKNNELPPVQL